MRGTEQKDGVSKRRRNSVYHGEAVLPELSALNLQANAKHETGKTATTGAPVLTLDKRPHKTTAALAQMHTGSKGRTRQQPHWHRCTLDQKAAQDNSRTGTDAHCRSKGRTRQQPHWHRCTLDQKARTRQQPHWHRCTLADRSVRCRDAH